jgi:two-component system cell cycle response regulator
MPAVGLLSSFARGIELREHTDAVANLARAVAIALGLDAEDRELVARAAELHDVGKLAVPEAILGKRSSHERWDGSGYPDRLAGERIPLGARIVAVCDAFAAMVQERAYGEAVSAEAALGELRRCAAAQFDARVVAAFCAVTVPARAA